MSSWSLSGWGALFSTAIVSVSTFFGNCAKAQITPDGTLPTNSSIENDVNTFNITGGTQSGGNLFHSFGEFSVPTDNTAFFNNSADIQNIISRVTGNSLSIIDGLIRANGTANLFLINPNGIIFGQNAQLNIGGSFLASTASAVKFANNLEFSATNPQPAPLLSINVPIGLQYGANPGFIVNLSQGFEVSPEKTLALVGGDVAVEGGIFFAPSGRIELGGVQEPGTVDLSWDGNILSLNFPDNLVRADVFLNGAQLDVAGENGGSIAVNARNIDILGASTLLAGILFGQGSVESQARDISLNATEAIKIDQQSRIENFIISDAIATGGDIRITTSELSVTDGAQLITSTFGQGNAGNLIIDAKQHILFDGISISFDGTNIITTPSWAGSFVEENARGNGGDVYISTEELSVTNGAQLITSTFGEGDAGNLIIDAKQHILFDGIGISFDGTNIFPVPSRAISSVEENAKGNGGDVYISTEELSVTNGAQIIASTFGQGDAGNLIIDAKQHILFDGRNNIIPTASGAASTVGENAKGNGGFVRISTKELSVTNGAQLVASTFGQGDAGNLIIDAKQRILFDSKSGATSTVEQSGIGKGGDVYINTEEISVTNESGLITSTLGEGDAGNLFINAEQRILFDRQSAAASTAEESGEGNSGNIYLSTEELIVSNGAQLTASTRGQGDAGNLFIDAKQRVLFDGTNSGAASTVEQSGIGKGGDIYLSTEELTVSNGAQLTASTRGQGDAGNLFIDAKQRILFDGTNSAAASTVEQSGIGKGGDIYLSTEELTVNNGAQLAASTRGQGDAGNLFIDAKQRILFDGTNSGAASTVEESGIGNGRDIRITTREFSVINGAQVTASTFGQGDAGNIEINASSSINISGTDSTSPDSSGLLTSTSSNSIGKGGDITLNTDIFRLLDGAVLDARTRNDGNGGNITVTANQVEVLNGGQLISSSFGNGRAGKISVNANDQVTVSGSDAAFNDRVARFPSEVLNIGSTSGFFVRSESSGVAGDIEVTSSQLTLANQGRFIAESASGDGGNINLQVNDFLRLRGNALISTNAGTQEKGGDGGNININAEFIVAVPNENSDITANAFTGRGGNVQINTQGIFGIEPRPTLTDASDITASSLFGVNGTIEINTPDIDPNSGLVALPKIPVDPQIAQGCYSPSYAQSKFVVIGRGGLPLNPREAFSNETPQPEWATLNESSDNSDRQADSINSPIPTSAPIVEATGWVTNAKGEIILTANPPTATAHNYGRVATTCGLPVSAQKR
ncbi:filamentous hemagglutinin N-terminal domain-containing protein [Nostoc sp. FACHB-973]|nr:filamentous hemagglutinin N-terminal domain-containing protein [Nostoc sp. FACHB-973]